MNIEITDYDRAEEIAENIAKIAGQMQETFNNLNSNMNQLHNVAWMSNPSSQAHERYNQFQVAFGKFYNETIRFCNVINETVKVWKEQNKIASVKEENTMDQVKPV